MVTFAFPNKEFMKKIFVISLLIFNTAKAQTIPDKDSTQTLENIVIKAFENNTKLIDVPAAISLVTQTDLNRYNNTSILSAMNFNPGVRMEERSPGSYRLSIRGSSVASPFGVRNVKVYYDGIPFTDPSGNTYLNQLGFYNFQSVEIIKGPASSLYGSGNGGVLLIRNDVGKFEPGANVSYDAGSYDLNNANVNVRFGNENSNNTINYQHQTCDGYRDHTNLKRDVLTWDAVMKSTDKTEVEAHFLYGNLYYQTPGALTKNEYDSNARAARPAAEGLPSADQAQAAIYQKTFLAGFSYEQNISNNFKNTTTLYGAYSQMENPSFRNYGRTTEPHFGGRTDFQFNKQLNKVLLTMNGGAEMQQSYNTQRIYDNKNGQTDSLQTDDEIYNNQAFVFLQANAVLYNGWTFTAGASINEFTLNFRRVSLIPALVENRNFNDQLTPRFALLKKLNNYISAYASIARGFNAPTTTEILPSTNVFNTTLQAETGINYELGTRGSLLKNKLYFDMNLFFYKLKNEIVQEQNSIGADYFENAGSAKQNGLETYLSYDAINNGLQSFNHLFIHASDTWNNFHYGDFEETNINYGGKELPGVAVQTVAIGVDVNTKPGIYANTTFFYSGRIAMNDANSQYASAYSLLGERIGYKYRSSKKIQFEVFTGADNIFNEKYSLGDDINAARGFYYNVAPGRNYYIGVVLQYK